METVVETINVAPRADVTVSLYKELIKTGKAEPDATFAVALVATLRGQGHVTLDRLSVTLNVRDEEGV